MNSLHSNLNQFETNILGADHKSLPIGYIPLRDRLLHITFPLWTQWEKNINNIVDIEINGCKTIKASNGSFSPHDLTILEKTILSTQHINPTLTCKKLLLQTKYQLSPTLPTSNPDAQYPTDLFIELWWTDLLRQWHKLFIEYLNDELKKSFKSKLSLGQGFYNLTQHILPDSTIQMLSKGNRYVPHEHSTPGLAHKRFTSYTAKFISWASENFEGVPLSVGETADDIRMALKKIIQSSSNLTQPFWSSILTDFELSLPKITENHDPSCNPCNEPLVDTNTLLSQTLPKDSIFAIADKHFGLVLLPLDTLQAAEVKMMQSMDAVLISETKSKIMARVRQDERSLRLNASPPLSKLLSSFPPIKTKRQEFPFLNLKPKIHKMSTQQLASKDVAALKFRPVNDSKYYTTKPASRALASLLVKLKNRIIEIFPHMLKFYPLSGFDVAKDMRSITFPTEKPFSLIVSCDLSDAYTNCTLEDIISASQFLSNIAQEPPENQKMIETLATFALKNNYIECGLKIYLCKPNLPMGNCLSGDALDIVAMAGELPAIVNPPLNRDMLLLKPQQVKDERPHLDITSYNRYRDDTKALFNSNSPSKIIESMKVLASQVFPPKIPISFEYATFTLSFLDCCFFINFSAHGFSTFPRLNFTRPSITIHSASNTWPTQLLRTHIGNAIRYNRLCSEKSILENIIHLMKDELKACGHTQQFINKATMKAREAITNDQNSTEDLKKLPYYDNYSPPVLNDTPVWTPVMPYNTNDNVTTLIENMIKNAKFLNIYNFSLPSATPNANIGKILVQKRKYRLIMSDFLSKQ